MKKGRVALGTIGFVAALAAVALFSGRYIGSQIGEQLAVNAADVIEKAKAEQEKYYGYKIFFRSTVWGMTKDEVIIVEGEQETEDDYAMGSSNQEVFGINALVGYSFNDDGKLYEGIYEFAEEDSDKNQCVKNYQDVKAQLTELYGEPQEDIMDWLTNLYKGDENEYGEAVSAGHLKYYTYWEEGSTSIMLFLGRRSTADSRILFGIVYRDNSIAEKKD